MPRSFLLDRFILFLHENVTVKLYRKMLSYNIFDKCLLAYVGYFSLK